MFELVVIWSVTLVVTAAAVFAMSGAGESVTARQPVRVGEHVAMV
jgi:hypothetical protein